MNIMAGNKSFPSISYYGTANRIQFRKPKLFNKNFKHKGKYVLSASKESSYREESLLSKMLSLTVVLLMFSVIGFLAYITFSYFVSVL